MWVDDLTVSSKASMFYVKKWQRKSFCQDNRIHMIYRYLCKIYCHMGIRQNRRTRGLLPFRNRKRTVKTAKHPELKKMRRLPNVNLKSVVREI